MAYYTTESFIKKVKEKLGSKADTLDFSEVEFTGIKDRVKVSCSVEGHGPFTPQAKSLTAGRGCPKCKNRITSEQFIINIKEALGEKCETLDFSQVVYKGYDSRVTIICSEHGPFTPQARSLSSGRGCPHCKGYTPSEYLVKAKKANKKYYNNEFDLSFVKYKGSSNDIEIGCSIHGSFNTLSANFLRGLSKCNKCNPQTNPTLMSNTKLIESNNQNIETILYSIRVFNDDESFYKIGITTKDIDKRFTNLQNKFNYRIEVLDMYVGKLLECKQLEDSLIKDNVEFKYIPKNRFGGYTECFTIPLKLHSL